MAGIGNRLYRAYRHVMQYKFSQMDIIRWRAGVGLITMVSLGILIEEWYYYSNSTSPMHHDTYLQYIQRRKDMFKRKPKFVEDLESESGLEASK